MTANNLYAAIASASASQPPLPVSVNVANAAAAAAAAVAKVPSFFRFSGLKKFNFSTHYRIETTRYKLYGSSKVQVEKSG